MARNEIARLLTQVGSAAVTAKSAEAEKGLIKMGVTTNHNIAELEAEDLTEVGFLKFEVKDIIRYIRGTWGDAAPKQLAVAKDRLGR